MSSLKNLAIRGTIWTIANYGLTQVLRFAGNIILTRLLVPEMFGLMALVNVFIMGLELFSDVGIGPSIIRHPRGDEPDFVNTAWTIQVVRGFGLWLFCIFLAWPFANFYGEEKLLWLIPLVGLTSVIAAFNSTALFTLNRKIALGKLTIFQITVQVVQLTITIIWAWFSPTIWALVVGVLVSSCMKMVWSHWLVEGTRNRFAWDLEALKELFSFGRWIFVSTAMSFLASQADKLLLGKLFLVKVLGVYTIASTLGDLPKNVVTAVSQKVMFPVVSRYADLPRQTLRAKILKKRGLMLAGATVLLTMLVCFGDVLILKLYDDRYVQAAWMLPILALGIWPRVLFQAINPALLAIGKPLYGAVGNFLKFLYMVICLPLAYLMIETEEMKLLAAIIIVAFNDLPNYGAVAYGMWRERLSMIGQDLQMSLLLIALIIIILGARYFLGFGLPTTINYQLLTNA
ncbi:MAG: oligosaccharide flippase family protein [Gomphosphaeria aponina SAG 52.96 = DSM 107014]|uniref:Oligosaccharide flippase family protein n=1 Tax=Gomphosphaeria aponina SAG 52.96 = DSM 107014 TaxID=1521640 RepID=A0A941GTW1_9CHRO|nr:oligosaccharide flippase family protein [Gomphosphaeria aponina SAG 52.96 = DSM 107014]